MEKISVIIPCYNSSQSLKKVVGSAIETISRQDQAYDYEVILVNDNSKDDTFKVIADLCLQDPKIKGLSLSRNFGQHGALMAGFKQVTGDIIVCMDDDGQTPPQQMFRLVAKLGEEVDVVYAKYEKRQFNAFRNWGSRLNGYMAQKLIGKPRNITINSYFAMKRYVLDEIVNYTNPYPYVAGLVLRTTDKLANVPIDHQSRDSGESGYTITKLLALWFNGFTSFSIKPLRLSTLIGAIIALLGFIYVIFLVINKVANPKAIMSGWSSLVAILVLGDGLLLVMLGLVGEYIGRIFISLNNSPQYVVKESINTEKDR